MIVPTSDCGTSEMPNGPSSDSSGSSSSSATMPYETAFSPRVRLRAMSSLYVVSKTPDGRMFELIEGSPKNGCQVSGASSQQVVSGQVLMNKSRFNISSQLAFS